MTTEQQTAALAGELSAHYGEGVTVEYVDLLSPEMFERHMDVLRLFATRQVPLPLVKIDDKPRFAGGISVPMICEALESLGLQPANGS